MALRQEEIIADVELRRDAFDGSPLISLTYGPIRIGMTSLQKPRYLEAGIVCVMTDGVSPLETPPVILPGEAGSPDTIVEAGSPFIESARLALLVEEVNALDQAGELERDPRFTAGS